MAHIMYQQIAHARPYVNVDSYCAALRKQAAPYRLIPFMLSAGKALVNGARAGVKTVKRLKPRARLRANKRLVSSSRPNKARVTAVRGGAPSLYEQVMSGKIQPLWSKARTVAGNGGAHSENIARKTEEMARAYRQAAGQTAGAEGAARVAGQTAAQNAGKYTINNANLGKYIPPQGAEGAARVAGNTSGWLHGMPKWVLPSLAVYPYVRMGYDFLKNTSKENQEHAYQRALMRMQLSKYLQGSSY